MSEPHGPGAQLPRYYAGLVRHIGAGIEIADRLIVMLSAAVCVLAG